MTVEETVVDIAKDVFGVDTISVSEDLYDNVGVDSLDMAEFILEIEERFDLGIPDTNAEKFLTLGDAIDYVEANK